MIVQRTTEVCICTLGESADTAAAPVPSDVRPFQRWYGPILFVLLSSSRTVHRMPPARSSMVNQPPSQARGKRAVLISSDEEEVSILPYPWVITPAACDAAVLMWCFAYLTGRSREHSSTQACTYKDRLPKSAWCVHTICDL